MLVISVAVEGTSPQDGDILSRNGAVINETGAAAVKADVLVRGSKIIAIDQLPAGAPEGVTVIDATGQVVAPGFIDTHSHEGFPKIFLFQHLQHLPAWCFLVRTAAQSR